MNLDEKLNHWREATETLEPSETLLASLQATIDAPTPPPPSGLITLVKVLIITAIVGAIATGYAVVRSLNIRWSGSSVPVLVATAVDAGLPSCGPEPAPAELFALPGSEVVGGSWEEMRRKQLIDFRAQLEARPLTCLAQRRPLEQLLDMHAVSDAEATRLIARLGWLCGPSALPAYRLPQAEEPGSCDNSDWCRRPGCDLSTEPCALSWADRPATTCTARRGRAIALTFACVRFLRAEAPEAQPRAFARNPWCLDPAAVAEREFLRTHNAVKASP